MQAGNRWGLLMDSAVKKGAIFSDAISGPSQRRAGHFAADNR